MELISEEMFKQYSPVTSDTGVADFVPYINIAQMMYIEEVIGPQLMAELELQIKTATEYPDLIPYPITPNNQALLKMIAPPLSFYAIYQGLPMQWAKIVNKGLTIKESENSKAVEIKDLAQLRRWIKDDAEFLLTRLIKYLCRCAINYPLWVAGNYCGGGCGEEKKNVTADFGIYIPER